MDGLTENDQDNYLHYGLAGLRTDTSHVCGVYASFLSTGISPFNNLTSPLKLEPVLDIYVSCFLTWIFLTALNSKDCSDSAYFILSYFPQSRQHDGLPLAHKILLFE